MRRLIAAYRDTGLSGVVSKKRGGPSNNKLSTDLKLEAIELITAHYYDFGPTLAQEKLLERHGIDLCKETVRRLMIEAGLWTTRSQRLKHAYQPRYRRECYGELIQIDGSEHAWFEKRGPKCTLLVFIDDATSRLMELRFVEEECTFTYFDSTKRYLRKHGKPMAFYSDKLSVFRVNAKGAKGGDQITQFGNAKGAKGGDQITQFGRALSDLNIDIICAHTPQAKGRVERANKTLQDRLVKELRLQNISTIVEANRFAEQFVDIHNQKFGKAPLNPRNVHRPLRSHENLDEIFCWHEDRTLSYNLTFQYNKILYLVQDTPENIKLARKRVTVYDFPDGSIKVKYEGRELPCSIHHDRLQTIDQGQIVDNKRLGNVLAFIAEKQAELNCERSKSVPRRKTVTINKNACH